MSLISLKLFQIIFSLNSQIKNKLFLNQSKNKFQIYKKKRITNPIFNYNNKIKPPTKFYQTETDLICILKFLKE